MRYKILIIGCGNIGLRYAQAIEKLNINIDIFFYDKFYHNSKKLVKSLKKKQNIRTYVLKKKPINQNFHLFILSTTADVRLKICKETLNKNKITKIIFEKVLCQSLKQLNDFIKLQRKHKFLGWISCHRSLWPDYIKLKKKIDYKMYKHKITFEVKGYNWGLGCNSVHFIHLFDFLFEKHDYEKRSIEIIDKIKWKVAKRNLFKDFNGKIMMKVDKNSKIILEDNKNNKDYKIIIRFGSNKIIIDEINNKIIFNKKIHRFKSEYLSSIYSREIKKILKLKKSKLPTLNETYDFHKHFIKSLLPSFNKFSKSKINDVVPIT